MNRKRVIVHDVEMGIVSHAGDARYVLFHDRDIVAEIVKSLRASFDMNLDYAYRLPTWVLREMHDKLVHADLTTRFKKARNPDADVEECT